MNRSKTATRNVDNAFKKAVENTPDIANGYYNGLHAVENADKNAICVRDNRKLNGSVNIDREVKDKYPNAPRWDYAICYDSMVCFIEVHPASTKDIDDMMKKKIG